MQEEGCREIRRRMQSGQDFYPSQIVIQVVLIQDLIELVYKIIAHG